MKRTFLRMGAVAVLLIAVLGLGMSWRIWRYLNQPSGGSSLSSIRVARGATLRPVLKDLAAQGVLSRPQWVYFYARLSGTTAVRAGEYEIRPTDTPLEILDIVTQGRLKMESFTLPEGFDRWQVRDFLVTNGWMTREAFDRLCDDQHFLAAHHIPGPSCDGYLFPETYTFARGVAAEAILAEMFATFQRVYAKVTAQGRGPMDLGARELVTLAAIVEKETGDPKERPRIACVFYNRLRAKSKWRLDTDPTVIYAAKLEDANFNGDLKREHLRGLDSPYNTYRIHGLPPGPIASAGREALEAVVRPATCSDFFFVSMNNGRHEFCPTLDCHNRAVQRWQVNYFQRHKR